jgi:hypothetical protein
MEAALFLAIVLAVLGTGGYANTHPGQSATETLRSGARTSSLTPVACQYLHVKANCAA